MRKLFSTLGLITVAVVLCVGPLALAVHAEGDVSKSERRALFREGAQLWPQVCGNCHKARPGGERSPGQWDVIMMHMRVRANLPGRQSRAILEFLKAR